MCNNDDLIGQRLSNNRQIFNKHILFDGGGERRGVRAGFRRKLTHTSVGVCKSN